MRSGNSTNPPTMLSRLPEWFGGLLGGGSNHRTRRTPETALGMTIAAVVEQDGELEIPDVPRSNNREVQSVIDQMLAQDRYALLLRPQLIQNLSPDQLARTRAALADGMCLVPEGTVVLKRSFGEADSDKEPSDGTTLRLEAYYLDRYPVTNAQFFQFVACGGYEQMQIWDSEIWAALLDFVDRSGHPGPRNWKDGHYPRGEEDHPVTGVSWYEAVAYARWIGKRLPSDAEWVKAGSWPVSIPGHPLMARRYPWGEAMDRSRANLWGSGPGHPVSVQEFPSGVSVGGAHQLIGNVWEWTADAFALPSNETPGATIQTKMKSLRGGAFDTYLDCQATCQFESADVALARKRNIGFRCAIHLSDLAARRDDLDEEQDSEENSFAENPS